MLSSGTVVAASWQVTASEVTRVVGDHSSMMVMSMNASDTSQVLDFSSIGVSHKIMQRLGVQAGDPMVIGTLAGSFSIKVMAYSVLIPIVGSIEIWWQGCHVL